MRKKKGEAGGLRIRREEGGGKREEEGGRREREREGRREEGGGRGRWRLDQFKLCGTS